MPFRFIATGGGEFLGSDGTGRGTGVDINATVMISRILFAAMRLLS